MSCWFHLTWFQKPHCITCPNYEGHEFPVESFKKLSSRELGSNNKCLNNNTTLPPPPHIHIHNVSFQDKKYSFSTFCTSLSRILSDLACRVSSCCTLSIRLITYQRSLLKVIINLNDIKTCSYQVLTRSSNYIEDGCHRINERLVIKKFMHFFFVTKRTKSVALELSSPISFFVSWNVIL